MSLLPYGNVLQVAFHQERLRIEISDKESEDDVDQEEKVDDIVDDQQSPSRMLYEPELKRRYPCRVEHQHHQKVLPVSVHTTTQQRHLGAGLLVYSSHHIP